MPGLVQQACARAILRPQNDDPERGTAILS